MASPQLEDGHTRIANEILEHLIAESLGGVETRLVLFVLRKTYGYGKPSDRISLSQFEKALRTNRVTVCRSIKSLVTKRILVKDNGVYKVNKNWEQWLVTKGLLVTKRLITSNQTVNPLVTKPTQTKETITKERSKERNINYFENFEKLKTHPLYNQAIVKYPGLDYQYEFGLMMDWYSNKKRKGPKAFSAFSNWIKGSKRFSTTDSGASQSDSEFIEIYELNTKRGIVYDSETNLKYEKLKKAQTNA